MKKSVLIGEEVVTLAYSVSECKVTVGDLTVLPVGLWRQLRARRQSNAIDKLKVQFN